LQKNHRLGLEHGEKTKVREKTRSTSRVHRGTNSGDRRDKEEKVLTKAEETREKGTQHNGDNSDDYPVEGGSGEEKSFQRTGHGRPGASAGCKVVAREFD